MKYGLDEKLYNEIIFVLTSLKFVKKTIIFGSRARGDYKYNSDIDLAVDIETHDELLKVMDSFAEINTIFKFDIVNINRIENEKFYNNIINEGIEIFPG